MNHPFGKQICVNPDNITCGYESFHGFDVEIVYVNNKLKHEYHLKCDGKHVNDNDLLLAALKRQFGNDCEVEYVDKTGIVTLDFPIYVIVKNQIIEDEMHNIWVDIEQFFKKEQSCEQR